VAGDGGSKTITVALIGAIATIVVALIGYYGQRQGKDKSSPTQSPTAVTSLPQAVASATPVRLSTGGNSGDINYPNVSGAWATGQDPDKTHYTIEQTGASVTSSSDEYGYGQGKFYGRRNFNMTWRGDVFSAEVFDDHLDWTNGTYWVRPGTRLIAEPHNISGDWAGGSSPEVRRWTLTEFPDHRVTSEGESGSGEGHFVSEGRFTMNWPSNPTTFTAVMRGNRLYWDNGTYWVRLGN